MAYYEEANKENISFHQPHCFKRGENKTTPPLSANMISIISDYSQQPAPREALSLVDFTLKSENLDYSGD